ncbi:putative oxidoreductase [Hyaloscypha finlandica]|nr:putative oxidoreductase [Hyaloscypha finlandica]
MKAYLLSDSDMHLQLIDIEKPRHSAGEHQQRFRSSMVQRPRILGHEEAGRVVTLGDEVPEDLLAKRVTVALVPPATAIGLDFDEGYAEFALAQAAVAADAVLTAYHAVVSEAGVDVSTTVAIIGLGGLGSIGLRVAALQGATVFGIDTDESKFAAAYKNGAKSCFTCLEMAKDVALDVVVDFAGMSETMVAALGALKQGGRIVLVGLGSKEQVEIRCSLGGNKAELVTVLALISVGKLAPVLGEVRLPFGKLAESLHRLGGGKAVGRLFTRPNRTE